MTDPIKKCTLFIAFAVLVLLTIGGFTVKSFTQENRISPVSTAPTKWFDQGFALYELKRYEEAITAYEKAIEINPQDVGAWNNKGSALGRLGRYEEAIKAIEKAIEINPQYAVIWNTKGAVLFKLERYEEAIKAYEKAIEVNPQHADAWNNKGVAFDKLKRYEEAIKAYEKAIEINQEDALAYSNLGELFFELGNLEDASKRVKDALERDENFILALTLQGRVAIEEKNYDAASKSFRQAISLDIGNPELFLWDAYASYLKAEFTLDSKGKKYQEEVVAIIRNLEKAEALSEKQKDEKEIRAYILYFLGNFYLKSNDIFAAKEKLEECIRLKLESPIKSSARELLGNIWNYRIRPPWWRWWLSSPLFKWCKRIVFSFLLLVVSALLLLLLLHPFIPKWFPSLKVNWTLYGFLIALLIIILTLPSIEHIKARDIEVELRSPPLFKTLLSPTVMEEKIREIEKKYPDLE